MNLTGQTFDVVQLTQHWRRLHGAWYRDAWVRVDGALRFVSIRDDLL
jgi:hypothetical protein